MTQKIFKKILSMGLVYLVFANTSWAGDPDSGAPIPDVRVSSGDAALCDSKLATTLAEPPRKILVLDTNVLIINPDSIYDYPDADMYIPLVVLEELDKFKREPDDRGRSARAFSRLVSGLRSQGSLLNGVTLKNGSKITFGSITKGDIEALTLPNQFVSGLNDNQILMTAMVVANKNHGRPVVLITEDINMWLKSDVMGIAAESYRPANKSLSSTNIFSGVREVSVASEQLDELQKNGSLPTTLDNLHANEFVILNSVTDADHSIATRYDASLKKLVSLQDIAAMNLPVLPRNAEQRMALDLLLNDNIKLVTLLGSAGTGKTLMAMLAGLYQTSWSRTPEYDEILLTRALVTMGKDVGALPGDLDKKTDPFMQPFNDNLQFMLDTALENRWSFVRGPTPPRDNTLRIARREVTDGSNASVGRSGFLDMLTSRQLRVIRREARNVNADLSDPEFQQQMYEKFRVQFGLDLVGRGYETGDESDGSSEQASGGRDRRGDRNNGNGGPKTMKDFTRGKIKIVAMPFIRGRTWVNRLLIIDEAQNLSAHEVKTLITRAGEGTKIVLLGDVTQIDAPYLNAYNNGLSLVIDLFKDESIAGHVTLMTTERSELVETAVRVFEARDNR